MVRDVELKPLVATLDGAGAVGVCSINKPTAAIRTTTPTPTAIAQVGTPLDWALDLGFALRGDILFPFLGFGSIIQKKEEIVKAV